MTNRSLTMFESQFFCRLILVLEITGLAVFGVQSQTQALLQTHTGVRDHNIY